MSLCAEHLLFGLCRWFRRAVFPIDRELESALFQRLERKKCSVCARLFLPGSNRAKYCPDCAYYMADIQLLIGQSSTEGERKKKERTRPMRRWLFCAGRLFFRNRKWRGTYTCELNSDVKVNGYTAQTAPIVMPTETPGYSAQAALTGYTSLAECMEAGFVYVHAGCRGRDAGAPAGVTDLKAAVRYLRYVDDIMPGDAEKIFVFGMSGGGAQSALVGATGDSGLYDPYLEQIGAVQGVSDAVYGSMDWCPITNLDSADEAYEWMMGVTRSRISLRG